MLFSEELKQNAAPILSAIQDHPFVQGIATGSLPKEALTFYVGQDFNYLNAFIKVYAAAVEKCRDRSDMAIFNEQINFILNSEIHPHHVFCNVAGVPYESLQHEVQAPMTYLYNEHMYNAARTGDLIDIVAAMLPCPWTYFEIANKLIAEGKNNEANVFKDWIDFYGSMADDTDANVSDRFFALIDREAENYNAERLAVIERRFMRSCELEWDFWEQAYRQQDWQFAPAKNLRQAQSVQH